MVMDNERLALRILDLDSFSLHGWLVITCSTKEKE
jgi:hypothetical protein